MTTLYRSGVDMTGLHSRYYTSERAAKAGARTRLREYEADFFSAREIREHCRTLFDPGDNGYVEPVEVPNDPRALCAWLNDIADENP